VTALRLAAPSRRHQAITGFKFQAASLRVGPAQTARRRLGLGLAPSESVAISESSAFDFKFASFDFKFASTGWQEFDLNKG
jgi:hypothetical protein